MVTFVNKLHKILVRLQYSVCNVIFIHHPAFSHWNSSSKWTYVKKHNGTNHSLLIQLQWIKLTSVKNSVPALPSDLCYGTSVHEWRDLMLPSKYSPHSHVSLVVISTHKKSQVIPTRTSACVSGRACMCAGGGVTRVCSFLYINKWVSSNSD